MNLKFEPMTEKSEKEVMDIFNYYIENSYATYFEKSLPYQFFSKFIEMANGYPAYVITKDNEKVIGFCLLKPYSPLPVFKETAEITCFIEKDKVGKGIGKLVLDLLEKEGRKIGIKYIMASISSLNNHSLKFHEMQGFKECGRFLDIGNAKTENFDVVWMQKKII